MGLCSRCQRLQIFSTETNFILAKTIETPGWLKPEVSKVCGCHRRNGGLLLPHLAVARNRFLEQYNLLMGSGVMEKAYIT